jgi:hypothetical protein
VVWAEPGVIDTTGKGCLRRHPRAPDGGAAAVRRLERAGQRTARLAGEETGARGSGAAAAMRAKSAALRDAADESGRGRGKVK